MVQEGLMNSIKGKEEKISLKVLEDILEDFYRHLKYLEQQKF
jgi:hypothetical protein